MKGGERPMGSDSLCRGGKSGSRGNCAIIHDIREKKEKLGRNRRAPGSSRGVNWHESANSSQTTKGNYCGESERKTSKIPKCRLQGRLLMVKKGAALSEMPVKLPKQRRGGFPVEQVLISLGYGEARCSPATGRVLRGIHPSSN